ncbi:MAG: 16S rRNA (guanine(966)-N(2))-methyltransferase RsmD [Spirochaetes bacterium]|nr:MAG: 16S rRNA (guanine(966)-N(2))-methyltransferase RsmD [Spirochaetota bacterium]
MRITGGQYSGRRVVCPPGEIRPAMDKMRESMFSILRPLDGSSFLDLFSGSGIVALEAASRGAFPVTAVEGDPGKRRILNTNISIANGIRKTITAYIRDVKKFIAKTDESYDYVFLDPPFRMQGKTDVLKSLVSFGVLKRGSICIIHAPRKEYIPLVIADSLIIYDIRFYGGSVLYFYHFSLRE